MITLPLKFDAILSRDQRLYSAILRIIEPFSDILAENKMYFFPEYTDHGIKHIENTLQYTENLIAEDTFQYLTIKEVGVILLSTVLHDIGMHTNAEMFKNMIEGKYDNLLDLFYEAKSWNSLWKEYLQDCRYWSDEKKKNIFGSSDYNIRTPDLSDLQGLTEYDKKLIGEFIRCNHCRIAHEIAINGYIGKETICFDCDRSNLEEYIKMAGIIARSHGMNVRDTFEYLEETFGDKRTPFGIHVVYLMALLRLADYLQIDSSRTNSTMSYINTMYSPYSQQEHKTHQEIKDVQFFNTDKEKILIHATPKNAQEYVKIERLVADIQKEFDLSWAILGETYTDNYYKLKYRRIATNISNEKYRNGLKYVPQQFEFRYNNDLFKLLIAPLYGNSPSYGVRELVQNAVDACRLCMKELPDNEPHVIVEVDSTQSLFTITDKGIGMSLNDIKYYFLTIGSSYNENINWQKTRDQEHLYRTGRFGIGVLASYLLGTKITVITRKRGENDGYRFTASINSKFIQIEKQGKADFGTRIEIKSDSARIKKLTKDDKWYNWYIGSKPKVVYYLDGKTCEGSNSVLKGFRQLKHSSDSFGTVFWKPRDFNVDPQESKVDRLLYCNDFLVCRHSAKSHFSHSGLDKDALSIPSLRITDTYNHLPLNLQRSNIDANVEYDFEIDLAKDMFIDTMCQLMASNETILEKQSSLLNIHAHGYSLNTPFFNSSVKETESVIIPYFLPSFDLLFDGSNYSSFPKSPKYIVQMQPEKLQGMLSFYESTMKRKRPRGYKKRGNGLFYAQFQGLFFAVPDDSSIKSEMLKTLYESMCYKYNDWCVFAPSYLRLIFEHLIDDFYLLPRNSRSVITVLCKPIKKNKNRSGITTDLFDKYMHKDPVVPFEMEKRKEKFPLLFEEFEETIKKYSQQPLLDQEKEDPIE